MASSSSHVLTYEEVCRLDQVLASVIQVHGRGNFPTLEVKPKEFINLLLERLKREDLTIKDIRLNGSTASYVLNGDTSEQCDYAYNDLDLIFNVGLTSASHFQLVKNSVLDTLKDFLPIEASRDRISGCIMEEAYVKKMVKVTNKPDTWSLISLTNNEGRNIELKFVDTMRRKYEFSIDSFQIILDSLIHYRDATSKVPMNSSFFPSVEAVSVYGNFKEALFHLQNKLIATKNPEEIRGGGLLKYCHLLAKDFKVVSSEIHGMEKYMCSRFFIDFKDVQSQQGKLESYLCSHSLSCPEKRYNYLMILYDVVENSTVCLMGHERRQTLRMILDLANQVFAPQPNYQQITVFYSVPPFMQGNRMPRVVHGHSHHNQGQPDYVVLGSWRTVNPKSVDAPSALVRCY